jgi:Uma2 family endonuclease
MASYAAPHASIVRTERWQALSEAERDGFPPLCPALVVELAVYMANGASLGWLLLPQSRTVEVWKAGAAETAHHSPLVITDPARLEAGPEFPGLVIEPRRIWGV